MNRSNNNSKGESHRIYWQQWISSNNSNSGERKSRRELITSSAAVRISHRGARSQDVTDLLRSTLHIGDASSSGSTTAATTTPAAAAANKYESEDNLDA